MDEAEEVMVISSTNSSEDSGYDNGFLSDSSTPSNPESPEKVCIFADTKNGVQGSQHNCALTAYNISGQCIKVMSPRTFQYFATCVRKLDLSNNKIDSLPETICELVNLEELNLSQNMLKYVPESWKEFHKLKVLNLSYNYLWEPPQCLQLGMRRLTHLDLSRNKISNFEHQPLSVPLLQCLNLSNNNFSSLPLWLFSEHCRSLVELDMSFNFCFDDKILTKKLPLMKHHRTSMLKTLIKLNICNTGVKLEAISWLLCQFESLQCLYISSIGEIHSTFNYFWDISINHFLNPCNIFELHIANVGLAGLPDNFDKFENLKVLDLSSNPLDWLPDSFGNLKSLEDLTLSDCNLSYLPDNFGALVNLKKLALDHNKLSSVSSRLEGLCQLEYLDLYDNLLEEFPLAYERMLNLQMLDLENNCLDLEVLLDCRVAGQCMLAVYSERKARLRDSDSKHRPRGDGSKVFSHATTWSSSESLHKFRDYEDLSEDNFGNEDQEDAFVGEEVEDWDDEFNCIDDYFDPHGVQRYSLPPGKYKFGWVPPLRQRECIVPISQILSGFIYLPGQIHERTIRRSKIKISDLPTVDGQFDDFDEVHGKAAEHDQDIYSEFLKQLNMFVRNPWGPKYRRCKFCNICEDCWHIGLWCRF